MKKFETPRMHVLTIEMEDVMKTSACFEIFDCEDCYCTSVTCDPVWECDGLKCPNLDMS